MKPFDFHPELFEFRNAVMEVLSENGYAWLSDFGSIDLLHDLYGLEVTGIRQESDAKAIEAVLHKMFPRWNYRRTFYEDQNLGELGWKVMISQQPEDFNDPGSCVSLAVPYRPVVLILGVAGFACGAALGAYLSSKTTPRTWWPSCHWTLYGLIGMSLPTFITLAVLLHGRR